MDQALKQRLVGATVLIILAVIVLPMLLSGRPAMESESQRIEVPDEPPELSLQTRRFPVSGATGEAPSVAPPPRPPVETPQEAPAPEPDEPLAAADPVEGGSETATTAHVPPAPVAAPAEEAVGARGRYLVQVASFSNPANANQLASRLREDGMPVLMDTVETAAGLLHRVRIGPHDGLSAAEETLARIRDLMSDLNPRIVDLRPDENAPVTDPSDPMVRWVVQAGSFTLRANADELLAQLKNQGYAAFVETVEAAGERAYKVKVGPFIERQTAVAEQQKIARDAGIDAIVTSMD